MHIHHLRNATMIVELGACRILVDPMLAPRAALPALRLLRARQKNPLVELPANADELLDGVTHCLITHCQKGHFDHLDRAGRRWLRERGIPVICTQHDAAWLAARGLNVQPLPPGASDGCPWLGGRIRTLPCTHGHGLVGLLMEHVAGYFIEMPDEPSLYLAGDTLLTPAMRQFLQATQPDVCVVPAGGAHFDIGGEIIMGLADVITFTALTRGHVVANHLEALSHCPVSRADLAVAARRAGVDQRLLIPADGDSLSFAKTGTGSVAALSPCLP